MTGARQEDHFLRMTAVGPPFTVSVFVTVLQAHYHPTVQSRDRVPGAKWGRGATGVPQTAQPSGAAPVFSLLHHSSRRLGLAHGAICVGCGPPVWLLGHPCLGLWPDSHKKSSLVGVEAFGGNCRNMSPASQIKSP